MVSDLLVGDLPRILTAVVYQGCFPRPVDLMIRSHIQPARGNVHASPVLYDHSPCGLTPHDDRLRSDLT